MRIAFILDEPWDSALTDYAFKIYRLTSREHLTKVFCLENSFISKRVDNASHIKPLKNNNPLKTLLAFFCLYRKLKEFEPNIVVTIRGDATFMSCLLKKNVNFRLIRVFGEDKKLKSPSNCIDKLILPCEFLKERVPKNLKDIVVIKSFVDTEKFKFSKEGRERIRKKFGLNGKIVFGAVGRLDKVKGYELLIEAFATADIPDSRLFIVGEEKGLSKKELISLADGFGVKNSIIVLTERRNDIVEIMSSFDVGVISSIGSEVIPRVFFEFLSVGLPIVSTDVGCLKEVSKETGMIITEKNTKSLSKGLKKAYKLLKENSCERNSISKKAENFGLILPPSLFKFDIYK